MYSRNASVQAPTNGKTAKLTASVDLYARGRQKHAVNNTKVHVRSTTATAKKSTGQVQNIGLERIVIAFGRLERVSKQLF